MLKRNLLVISVLFVLVLGCAASRLHIRSIKDNPTRFKDSEVVVSGKVVQVIALPFLDKGICKISDGSGEIWVKPARRVPNKGEALKIRGKVKVGLKFGNRNIGIIIIENTPKS